MSDIVEQVVHNILGESPNPVVGAAGGAVGGAVVGTVAVVKLASLATVVGAVKAAGIVTVASVASPVLVPAIAIGVGVGFLSGLKNWLDK